MIVTSRHTARGKVVDVKDGLVVFHPHDTNYRLHLTAAGPGAAAVSDKPVEGIIRARARKILTVPSGGLFIAPIFGPPRTIQGRVRELSEYEMVLQCGTLLVVELPTGDSAYDLTEGPIEVGKLVNVAATPGASFEPLGNRSR